MITRRTSLALIFLGFTVVAGLLVWYFAYRNATHFLAGNRPADYFAEPPPPAPVMTALAASDPARGSTAKDAVTIVEYGDLTNPLSRAQEKEVQKLLLAQSVPVRFVWKDLLAPTDRTEPFTIALAIRCAGEQERYWEMHDAILKTTMIDANTVPNAVKVLGLDRTIFDGCFNALKKVRALTEDLALAKKNNIISVPTLFVNGKPFTDPLTAEALSSAAWWAHRNTR